MLDQNELGDSGNRGRWRDKKGSQIMWALIGCGRGFEFYSELNGEPGGTVQRSDML